MRRISVSNIAWPTFLDPSVSLLINGHVSYIDLAPSKYFDLRDPNLSVCAQDVLSFWLSKGIKFSAFQSLLFDNPSLNIFHSQFHRKQLLCIFENIALLASLLGVNYLIFGSAKNRTPVGSMSSSSITDISLDFFHSIGEICSKYNILFCLEAMPLVYDGRFLTNHTVLFEYVDLLAHSSVKANLDLGICSILEEDLSELLLSFSHLVGHVHVSEPGLLPLSTDYQDHSLNSRLISKFLPVEVPLSLEMKFPGPSSLENTLSESLELLISFYG